MTQPFWDGFWLALGGSAAVAGVAALIIAAFLVLVIGLNLLGGK